MNTFMKTYDITVEFIDSDIALYKQELTELGAERVMNRVSEIRKNGVFIMHSDHEIKFHRSTSWIPPHMIKRITYQLQEEEE